MDANNPTTQPDDAWQNNIADQISPSEALFLFMGWLTTRDEVTTLSANHDSAPAAQLVGQFCDAYNLSEPDEYFHTKNKAPAALLRDQDKATNSNSESR